MLILATAEGTIGSVRLAVSSIVLRGLVQVGSLVVLVSDRIIPPQNSSLTVSQLLNSR